ncbi:MAG: membrane protein insertase YidC [Gammaproteobacteria bacterium]|nr:membrane protein insertase YidC [Gammaproteobacteria bacterium]
MDNLRLFLWLGFGLLLWITFQAWQADYAPRPTPVAADAPAPGVTGSPEVPEAPQPELPDLPAAPDTPAVEATEAPSQDQRRLVKVETDVLQLQIDLNGGDLVAATLPDYPIEKDQPDVPVRLLSPDPASLYVIQSGLRAPPGSPEVSASTPFTSAANSYALADGENELVVPVTWEGPDGVRVEKIFRFQRGRYDIALEQRVTNTGATAYQTAPYLQILRRHQPMERSMFNVDSYSFTGPVAYDGEKYEKLDVDDLQDEVYEQSVANGWLASIEHHFLGAAVPPANEIHNYRFSYDGSRYSASAIAAQLSEVVPGETVAYPAKIFVGPKLQSQLNETADGLALTVDYGMLTLLAQPLFWVLEKVHGVAGNWGWTIIIVTFLIKLVFYKLTETSGRSMAKMRKMAPRLKALQDRYKDDREALSRAMMDLYKREKVNPAAGCLPMLIQIPFFIAFYWVLLESVEMRQAPFMLWITDLSSRDPFFILPLLMGAAMWFQQKLNPAPPDPVQAKVMMFLPILFTAMFAFFPAGLVLYWLTNSVLSIAQQWRINKVVGAD